MAKAFSFLEGVALKQGRSRTPRGLEVNLETRIQTPSPRRPQRVLELRVLSP